MLDYALTYSPNPVNITVIITQLQMLFKSRLPNTLKGCEPSSKINSDGQETTEIISSVEQQRLFVSHTAHCVLTPVTNNTELLAVWELALSAPVQQ